MPHLKLPTTNTEPVSGPPEYGTEQPQDSTPYWLQNGHPLTNFTDYPLTFSVRVEPLDFALTVGALRDYGFTDIELCRRPHGVMLYPTLVVPVPGDGYDEKVRVVAELVGVTVFGAGDGKEFADAVARYRSARLGGEQQI